MNETGLKNEWEIALELYVILGKDYTEEDKNTIADIF